MWKGDKMRRGGHQEEGDRGVDKAQGEGVYGWSVSDTHYMTVRRLRTTGSNIVWCIEAASLLATA